MTNYIDKVVEGYLSGDKSQKQDAIRLYGDMCPLEEIQTSAVCIGTLVPNALLEFDPDQASRFEEDFPAERIAAFGVGEKPTAEDAKLYRKCILAEAEDGGGDSDLIPGFWINRLFHTDGREIYTLTTVEGYSFSGIRSSMEGFFDSEEDALRHLSLRGVAIGITRRRQDKRRRKV